MDYNLAGQLWGFQSRDTKGSFWNAIKKNPAYRRPIKLSRCLDKSRVTKTKQEIQKRNYEKTRKPKDCEDKNSIMAG